MKRYRLLIGMFILCICLTPICTSKEADAAYKLNKKVYAKIKDKWFSEFSSGGDDVKFIRTKIKYYSRETGKLKGTGKIAGCKTLKKGYLIKIKNGKKKYSYYLPKGGKAKGLDFFGGWTRDMNEYSGSSSLFLGKWSSYS